MKSSQSIELNRFKQLNSRLQNTIDEMKSEIAFYKGENKQLQWENDLLNNDITKISNLAKEWMDSMTASQFSKRKNLLNDSDYFQSLVQFPCRSVSDVLQIDSACLMITSSQSPYFIEYVNKPWIDYCGWESTEVLGTDCGFLQGKDTDRQVVHAFMDDIKHVGFARMRIRNYIKKGQWFEVTVVAYPVYDSKSTEDSEPVLTHYASVMMDMESEPKSQEFKESSQDMNASSSSSESAPIDYAGSSSATFEAKFSISTKKFYKFGQNLRISNLLRLMLSCHNPLILTSCNGQILHVNKGWTELTGYQLSEVEGKTCSILQGVETNSDLIYEFNRKVKECVTAETTIINYKKNGSKFLNKIIVIPIYGGYLTSAVTHHCGLLTEVQMDEYQKVEMNISSRDHSTMTEQKGDEGIIRSNGIQMVNADEEEDSSETIHVMSAVDDQAGDKVMPVSSAPRMGSVALINRNNVQQNALLQCSSGVAHDDSGYSNPLDGINKSKWIDEMYFAPPTVSMTNPSGGGPSLGDQDDGVYHHSNNQNSKKARIVYMSNHSDGLAIEGNLTEEMNQSSPRSIDRSS